MSAWNSISISFMSLSLVACGGFDSFQNELQMSLQRTWSGWTAYPLEKRVSDDAIELILEGSLSMEELYRLAHENHYSLSRVFLLAGYSVDELLVFIEKKGLSMDIRTFFISSGQDPALLKVHMDSHGYTLGVASQALDYSERELLALLNFDKENGPNVEVAFEEIIQIPNEQTSESDSMATPSPQRNNGARPIRPSDYYYNPTVGRWMVYGQSSGPMTGDWWVRKDKAPEYFLPNDFFTNSSRYPELRGNNHQDAFFIDERGHARPRNPQSISVNINNLNYLETTLPMSYEQVEFARTGQRPENWRPWRPGEPLKREGRGTNTSATGITNEQIRQFASDVNYDIETIYDAAKEFGVTNSQVAHALEIPWNEVDKAFEEIENKEKKSSCFICGNRPSNSRPPSGSSSGILGRLQYM